MELLKKKIRTPGFWVSAAGLLVLTAAFVLWRVKRPGTTAAGLLSALLSAALFAAVCLRFVPRWMEFWRRDADGGEALPEADEPAYMGLKIFAALLLFDAAVIVLVYLLRLGFGHHTSFLDYLDFWRCTDSQHYLAIAEDWYIAEGDWDRMVQLVFLPGYPLAVRLVNFVVGNYLLSGLLVSALSFAGAGCVCYRLLRLDYSHGEALRALCFLCLIPGSFFYAAPMSESLFLLLCLACIYCARTKAWLAGCIFGALAAFTRSLGLVLTVPLFFELVSEAVRAEGALKLRLRRFWVKFAAILLVPLGFGVYCYINYRVSGDPFKFMEYQSVHWGQKTGWFFNTAAYQMEEAVRSWSGNFPNAFGLWIPNLLAGFLSLALLLPAVKRLRPSYTAWFLVYYLVAMGATWLLSAPRYLLVMLPIPIALARLSRRRDTQLLFAVACTGLALLYLCAFVMRWQVW